jgi:predicted amidophosphoribosyltransferase
VNSVSIPTESYFTFDHFTGCVRCGKFKCLGMCAELPEFETLSAPYVFSGAAAKLMNFAKQQENQWAQAHVTSLIFKEFQKKIIEIFENTAEPLFVIPSIRITRLWNTQWHPNFEMVQIIQTISEGFGKTNNILWKTSFFQTQKAKINPTEREKLRESLAPQQKWYQKSLEMKLYSPRRHANYSNIWVLDDVLTTGLSAMESYYSNSLRNYWHLPWHLFTLFRTPRTASNQEDNA